MKRGPMLEKPTKHKGERYEVGLLWADDNSSLSNNYYSANQQLTLDKGLKFLKEENQSALILKIGDRLDNSFCEPQ